MDKVKRRKAIKRSVEQRRMQELLQQLDPVLDPLGEMETLTENRVTARPRDWGR